jgi:tetratricopeptide (TPR) repeat protein
VSTISRELNEFVNKEVEPLIEVLTSKLRDQVEINRHKPGVIPQNIEQEEKSIIDAKKWMTKWLNGADERDRFEAGCQILVEEANNFAEGQALLDDICKAGLRLNEHLRNKESKKTDEVEVYESTQQWLGISDQTIQGIYVIANHLYVRNESKKALVLFSLLTSLNHFIFEPWLALGITYREEKNYAEALMAFSNASLIDIKHAAPHLYSAELYLLVGDEHLAQQTLAYGLSLITPSQAQEYSVLIEGLQKQLTRS